MKKLIFVLSPMHSPTARCLAMLFLPILVAPFFVFAAPPEGGAQAKFSGELGTLTRGLFTTNRFAVDGAGHFIHGSVYLSGEGGESNMRFDGTIDSKTGALKVIFSGSDDLNFALDKSDRQSSYLRDAFEGSFEATLAVRESERSYYVWEGPVAARYISVRAKESHVTAPEEKKEYTGRLELVVDVAAVSGLDSLGVVTEPTIKLERVSVESLQLATSTAVLENSSSTATSGATTTSDINVQETKNGDGLGFPILLFAGLCGIVLLAWPKKIT